ncbi:MAG: DUF3418 domain-containing protein, partial [Planctomycetaceae bacterium]
VDAVSVREQVAGNSKTDSPQPQLPPEEQQWYRTGFRDWDFADIPASIEVRRAGMIILAFPSVRDDQDSVSLTLCRTSEEAQSVLQSGLRRLFLLTNTKRIRNQVDNLPGLSQLRLQASSIRGLRFSDEIAMLMTERAFLSGGDLPRTPQQFAKSSQLGRQRLGVVAQELTQFLPQLFRKYHETRRLLENTRGPGWQQIVENLKRQVNGLIHPHLFSQTPWPWLIQIPRYLTAVQLRIQRLNSGGLKTESSVDSRIQTLEQMVEEVQLRLERQNRTHPLLDHARWLIQEYRVQLGAQKLGTAVSVSEDRICEVLSGIS